MQDRVVPHDVASTASAEIGAIARGVRNYGADVNVRVYLARSALHHQVAAVLANVTEAERVAVLKDLFVTYHGTRLAAVSALDAIMADEAAPVPPESPAAVQTNEASDDGDDGTVGDPPGHHEDPGDQAA